MIKYGNISKGKGVETMMIIDELISDINTLKEEKNIQPTQNVFVTLPASHLSELMNNHNMEAGRVAKIFYQCNIYYGDLAHGLYFKDETDPDQNLKVDIYPF